MPKYQYKSPSLIDEVTFFENEGGTKRAYLHAAEHVTDDQIGGMLLLLRHHDYDCVPHSLNGKPVLEVRNFGKPNALLRILRTEHITAGEPAIERFQEDELSFREKLSKQTLRLSGFFQLVGDYGFMKYNKLEGHSEGSIASYFYTLGTLALLGYGNTDQSEVQVRDMAKAFERFIEKKGDVIPDNCSLRAIAEEREKGPLQKVHAFFQRYPSETYNTLTGIAGAMVAVNAYKNHVKGVMPAHYSAHDIAELRKEGMWDVGLGLTTLAATTYGTLVKEKKMDPNEQEAATMPGRAIQYIKHHPLSVTGMGLMVSTLCHAVSTAKAYKVAKRNGDERRLQSVPWRGMFVGVNLMAELLIMISSKGHGEGVTSDDTVNETAYKIAAEIILNQPKEKQQEWVEYMTEFLEQPDMLAQKHSLIISKLHAEMEKIKDNPWLCSNFNKNSQEHVLIAGQVSDKSVETWSDRIEMPVHAEHPITPVLGA